MKFTFKDITNTEMYSSAKIMFVTGPYNLFNNIVIDEMKEKCRPTDIIPLDSKLLSDFGDGMGDPNSQITISNTVDFNTFTKVINVASMNGKWFTSVDYTFLSKKQKDWLNSYMKAPTNNGILVVYCNEYKDYKILLRNKIINNSTNIHLIQLSFPARDTLQSVVRAIFEGRGVKIEQRAIELFIMRMSSSYDEYEQIVDKIIIESVPEATEAQDKNWKYTITYDDTLNAMKGIENYVLDDFMERLLIPIKSSKITGKSKIYRMLDALIDEMGPIQLVNKLRYKIDDYMEFRLIINKGIIPIQIKFSVPEAKGRLPEDHKFKNISDYSFRRMANIAGQTSLQDWIYMKMILNNVKYRYDSTSYERALYSLINRTILNESRLNNAIGMDNIMNLEIRKLDEIKYNEEELEFYGE